MREQLAEGQRIQKMVTLLNGTAMSFSDAPTKVSKGCLFITQNGNTGNVGIAIRSDPTLATAAETDVTPMAKNQQIFLPISDLSSIYGIADDDGQIVEVIAY